MFYKLHARRKIFYFVFMTSGFYRSTSLNKFSRVALWKEKSYSLENENVFNLHNFPTITMLGTSTASGNFSDEGKTCVIFTSALFALFSSMA